MMKSETDVMRMDGLRQPRGNRSTFHVPSSTFLLNGHRVTDFQHTEETTKGNPTQGYIAVQVHPGGDWIDGNKARLRHTVLSVRPQT